MKRQSVPQEAEAGRPRAEAAGRASRLPPLEALRAFEVAARRLSFTAAASELCVTQSAVSQRIRALELELGVALFVRLPHGLALSQAGERLERGVREGLQYVATAVAAIEERRTAGPLNVSLLPSFAALWLVPRLAGFSRKHADIEIRLHAEPRPVELHPGGIDVAIRFGDGHYPGLSVTRLMGDSVVPMCSRALLARHGRPRTIEELLRFPLLYDIPTAGDASGSGWPDWLAGVGAGDLRLDPGLRFNQADLVIEAAARGLGLALVRTSLVANEVVGRRLVRAWPEAVPTAYSYFYLCRKEMARDARISAFRDWLVSGCRQHSDPA